MKISQYTEISQLGDGDYIPIARNASGAWSSWRYKLTSLLSHIGFDTATKRFSQNVLPGNTVYSTSRISLSQMLPTLFADALNANQNVWKHGSQSYSDVGEKPQGSTITQMRENGYYPDVDGKQYTPYYAYGAWLTEGQAMAMLFDRYTPYSGGLQCSSAVNIPAQPKATDTALRLDYAVCNNHRPRVVVLGNGGWADSVAPLSVHRAFHNGSELRAVIGEIDLRYLTAAPAIFIENCPELWQIHLANIPDCIEMLDLSGCSADIKSNHRYHNGSSLQVTSSLAYLADNYKRDIVRTKGLTIKVPSAAYTAAANAFAAHSDVTITEIS